MTSERCRSASQRGRVASIDVLRGFVMVVMALDHVRGVWSTHNPVDLATTTPQLFATRWITHLCAPVFVLLAGVGAGLSGLHKSKGELARFLLTRGLWLVVLELTIVKFTITGWTFWEWDKLNCLVIWVLGWSMVALGGLIYLPQRAIVAFGLVLVVGHNALDGISPDQLGPLDWLWQVLHVKSSIGDPTGFQLRIGYPLIPWIGVMALGYSLGVYLTRFEGDRVRLFSRAGLALVVAFVVLRAINGYGDLHEWSVQDTASKTIMSFMNVTKYPPSLDFLCVTLGLSALLLAAFERMRGALTEALRIFGLVPLFYYVLHMLVITQTGDVYFRLRYGEWANLENVPDDWGQSLWIVYAIWIATVAALHPICRWFAGVKHRRRDWWLRYL